MTKEEKEEIYANAVLPVFQDEAHKWAVKRLAETAHAAADALRLADIGMFRFYFAIERGFAEAVLMTGRDISDAE